MTSTENVKPPSTLPAFLSLFTSTGTLICCALPALLVSLGAGAVMAGLIDALPQIVWLGKNKELVFGVAAALIAASGAWQWHARTLPCPADKAQADACARARKVSWVVWWISLVLFLVGGFFAFFAARLIG